MEAAGSTVGSDLRCGCGRRIEEGHRYCPDCGSLVGHLAADAPHGDGAGVLLAPAGGPVRSDGEVRTERSGLGLRLAALGGVLIVALLAWALFRQPTDEIVPEGDEPAADDRASSIDDPAGVREGADTEDDPAESVTDESAPTPTTRGTTTGRPGSASVDVAPSSAGASGPLLGEETGLSLLTVQAGMLEALDLDTGRVRELTGVRGDPVAVIGTTLVLHHNATVEVVDLAEPGAEPRPLIERTGGSHIGFAAVDDDLIWVSVQGPQVATPGFVAFDVTGAQQAERDWNGALSFGSAFDDRLVTQQGGGIYRPRGAGFDRVSTGLLLAIGEDLALVHECDDAMVCRTRWYDVETWSVRDLPDPPAYNGQAMLTILGADRWLHVFDWSDNSSRLIEVATGEPVRDLQPRFGPTGPAPVLSDDGRWLLDRRAGTGAVMVVVDLDRGTEHETPLRMSLDRGALFIETAALPA